MGMLIGVPLFAVIYRIISRIVDYRLRRKGLIALADAGSKTAQSEKKSNNSEIDQKN